MAALRIHYPNSQSVVLEVAKAVGLALQNFHFVVKPFDDSIITGESPHGGGFLGPGGQSRYERSAKPVPADHPSVVRLDFGARYSYQVGLADRAPESAKGPNARALAFTGSRTNPVMASVYPPQPRHPLPPIWL